MTNRGACFTPHRWGDWFLFIENPRRGGGSPGREGPRGREGVCSELGNFGGGLNIFFGAEMPTKTVKQGKIGRFQGYFSIFGLF